jgi:hypothetical protein
MRPVTVFDPVSDDWATVVGQPPPTVVTMNVVHGDSLDDAVHLTLALSLVRRSAEAVTVNGRQPPHLAYSVASAVKGYVASSA